MVVRQTAKATLPLTVAVPELTATQMAVVYCECWIPLEELDPQTKSMTVWYKDAAGSRWVADFYRFWDTEAGVPAYPGLKHPDALKSLPAIPDTNLDLVKEFDHGVPRQ